MNKVNRDSIRQLLETEDSASVSIYLPTHRFPTSEHITEDKIRFKNLIRRVKESLAESGVDDGISATIVAELEGSIYNDDQFWQQTTDGLAVFCSPAGLQYFHLPIECDERVSVGEAYDVTPLLALMSYDAEYLVLALAMHHPVLLKGDMYGVERVAVELPESPETALNIDELFSNSRTARSNGYGAGNPGTKSHGQGDSRQAGSEERMKYFRIIEDKINNSGLVDQKMPIILAGTEDEVSGYREASRSKRLMEASLSGNYTEAAPHDIYARIWPLVSEEVNKKKRAEVIDQVGSLIGTGRASTDLEDICRAAKEGRVDTLLVAMLAMTRDTVKDSTELVEKLLLPENYTMSQHATCGRDVFEQGGNVMAMFREEMPAGVSEAAVYRY